MLTKSFGAFFSNFVYKLFLRNEPFSDMEKTYLRVIGAVLFGISDIFVAREKFLVSSEFNSIIGLPVYFFAQQLIAYSM